MQTHTWLIYAILAAVCAGMINVVGKLGLKNVNSDLATAIRSVVQAGFVVSVAAALGVFRQIGDLQGNTRAYLSILLSGVLGGLSWIFVFRALQLADASKVGPIDKLSLPISVILAVLILKERPSLINWTGIGLVVIGGYLASVKH